MKVDGIPDGYEILRIGKADYLDIFVGDFGDACVWDERESSRLKSFVILRKVERPKQYRPFASAEEFTPHRDRWTRRIAYEPQGNDAYPPKRYSDLGYDGCKWQWCFENFSFDDGTPFGVEVSE